MPTFPTAASQVGIAGVGLTNADLTVWDCAVSGANIPGGTYDKVRFINIPVPGLYLQADNMTFTKCKFEGPDDWPNPPVGTRYLINPDSTTVGVTGHLFEDCEIIGGGIIASTSYNASATTPAKPFPLSGNASQNPFGPGMAYTLRRCDIRRFEHLLQPTGNPSGSSILIELCFLHEFVLVQYAGDVTHVDGMQSAGVGVHDLTIRYCNFDLYNPSGATDQFQIANASTGGLFGGFPLSGGVAVAELVNVDIHHNRYNGGQKAFGLSKAAYDPPRNTYLASAANASIHDNVLGLQHLTARDTIGTALDGTQITWSGNTWEATGTTRGGDAVTAGQEADPTPVTTGDIVSVEIGADGWYADVTISGLAAGGTYSFGLGANGDPDTGTPKVVFTAVSLGFDTTGTATTVSRTIYGTHQVRKAYPNDSTNEESTAGGNVTVRVALSDYIYAKDTIGTGNSGADPTATFLSGFYTATTPSSAAVVAVTNSSTRAYPKVVGNWSWPGYDKLGSTFTLRAVAYHASALSVPVQCVKFTATDASANSVTVAVTAMSVDASVGDAIPVPEFIGTLSAAALTQGQVVTCNFIAYPRVGDTAACLDTSAGTVQPTPLYGPIKAVCDKNGTYATSVVVVDPVSGNDGTGAVTASFSTGSPPAAYLTMAAAYNALRAFNNTTYSRNNCGGSIMYLRTGTHAWVNGSVTLGTAPDAWLTIAKFPTDARSGVIVGNKVTGQSLGLRVKLQDVKITGQDASGNISGGASAHLHIDRCEIDCPTSNAPPFYIHATWYLTRCLVTVLNMGVRPYALVNAPPGIVRGSTVIALSSNREVLAYTVLGNIIPATYPVVDVITSMTAPASVNTVVAYNRMSGNPPARPAIGLRMTTTDTHGAAVVQNIVEVLATTSVPALQIAADNSVNTPVNNVIVWNNVVVGQRCNIAYNEVDTASGGGYAERWGWSVKNNIFDDGNIKSDTFAGAGYVADGAKIGNWSFLFGCGCSGNFWSETAGIGAPGTFLWELLGLKSYQPSPGGTNTPAYVAFVNRASYNGTTTGAGGGAYRLTDSSPAFRFQRDLVLPIDLAGVARAPADGVGAYATSSGAALLAGVGGLTAGAKQTSFATVNLAGVGALTAAGFRNQPGAATLVGIGALTAAGVVVKLGTVTLAGLGSLTAAGFISQSVISFLEVSSIHRYYLTEYAQGSVAAFASVFNADWASVLGDVVTVGTEIGTSSVAVIFISRNRALVVNPGEYVGFNYNNWEVVTPAQIADFYVASNI